MPIARRRESRQQLALSTKRGKATDSAEPRGAETASPIVLFVSATVLLA
jgi:hypothetical protein